MLQLALDDLRQVQFIPSTSQRRKWNRRCSAASANDKDVRIERETLEAANPLGMVADSNEADLRIRLYRRE